MMMCVMTQMIIVDDEERPTIYQNSRREDAGAEISSCTRNDAVFTADLERIRTTAHRRE
jgi:hypothetical protein